MAVTNDTAENPTGTTHTLTATITNIGGACTDTAFEVDFEVESGPVVSVTNDDGTNPRTTDADNSPTSPDMTCTVTDPATSCIVQFTSSVQGTDVIRAWVDDDKDNVTADLDATEGRWAGGTDDLPGTPSATAVPGSRTEPDDTDVVTKAWTQSVAAACLDAEPGSKTNPSGTDHIITAKATSSAAAITDLNGTFECTGSALANTTVNITVGDDDPNIFIKAVNGTSTGGPIGGGPNGPVNGTTDANGQVTVTIACVSAAVCTGLNTVTLAVQGAVTGTSSETVSKTWAPAGGEFNLDATPETATNELGQTHTITCSSTDQFGDGVAGTNCDARVSAGPNDNNDIGADANTAVGYVGQCTTGADGTCTISYTSAELGTDTIQVFNDANGNDTQQGGEDVLGPNPSTADQISKTWVAVGGGTADVDIDMSNTGGGLADCDDIANGTDDVSDDSTATNPVASAHEVCAERFGPTGVAQAGPVTFTIVSGPGEFFNDANGNGTRDTGELSLGATFVAEEGTCNTGATLTTFNCVSVYSTATGNTVVHASANNQHAEGTKTWTTAPANARNIELTVPAEAEPGTIAQASALVTDVFGNPVPGVQVTFGETGPAVITSANPATTGTNGVAEALYTSGVAGTSTVTAALTAGGAGTDCDLLAGNPAGATAGNCTDSGVTVWTAPPPPKVQCNNGIDDDGDGLIDFPADLGCDSATDTTETNRVTVRHNRSISIRFVAPQRRGDGLIVKGRVRVLAPTFFNACRRAVPVKVQRRTRGQWVTRKSTTTNRRGRYAVEILPTHSRFRAVATRFLIFNPDTNTQNVCKTAKKVKRYRGRL